MARPTWGQVRRFCAAQGDHETRTDHDYFDQALPDGSSSGTKVSFGAIVTSYQRGCGRACGATSSG